MKRAIRVSSQHNSIFTEADYPLPKHNPQFFNPPNPQPTRQHLSSLPALPPQNSHMPSRQSVQQILRSMRKMQQMGEEKTKAWLQHIKQEQEDKKKEEEFIIAERRVRNRLSIINKKKQQKEQTVAPSQWEKIERQRQKQSRKLRMKTFEPSIQEDPSQITNSNEFMPTRKVAAHSALAIHYQKRSPPSRRHDYLVEQRGLRQATSPSQKLQKLYLHSARNEEAAERALQLVKRIGRARRSKRRNPTVEGQEETQDKLRLLSFLQSLNELSESKSYDCEEMRPCFRYLTTCEERLESTPRQEHIHCAHSPPKHSSKFRAADDEQTGDNKALAVKRQCLLNLLLLDQTVVSSICKERVEVASGAREVFRHTGLQLQCDNEEQASSESPLEQKYQLGYHAYSNYNCEMRKRQFLRWGASRGLDAYLTETIDHRSQGADYDNRLRNTAVQNGVAALSPPFVGDFWKGIVILGSGLKQGQWSGYKQLRHSHFKAYLNPTIQDSTTVCVEQWQQSLGYPGVRLLIVRPEKVRIQYNLPKRREEVEEQLAGFMARLFQHHYDVLECVDPLRLATKIEIVSQSLREQYGVVIEERLKEYRAEVASGKLDQFRRSNAFNLLRRELIFGICQQYCCTEGSRWDLLGE